MKVISVFLAPAIFLTACGGGSDDETLHMRNFDIKPATYRAALRGEIASNFVGWSIVCKQLDGLPDADVVTFFKQANQGSTATPTIPTGAIPKPGQEPRDSDALRAARIIKGECDRTF